MSTLKNTALHSIKWSTFQTISTSILIVGFQLIKANLLGKEEFAILSILMVIIGLTQMLNNFGISHAIIQKSNVEREDISSLFFLNLLIALLLSSMFFLAAGLIAEFYGIPDASKYLKWATFFIIIAGPSGLLRALHEKELYFRQLSIILVISKFLLVLVSTILIYLNFGVKGVILGYIFSELSKNILLIISLKKRGIPFIQLYFSLNRLKPFIKFSILVFSKQLFNFFARKADEIIIGGYFAPEILGDYFFAKDSILKIVQLINQAITRVFFPLFSKIKNQIQQVKKYYFYLIRYMSLIAFPILMGLILVADPLIPIIFGEKWDNTIYLFQLLAIPAFFTIITANNATAVLYALNKPSLVLKIEVYINIVYFILLFIVVKYGFIYLVITTIVKMISKAILLQFLCGKKIYMTFLNYMSSLRYTLLSTSIMVIIVLSLSNLLKEYHIDGILNLSLLILSGGTTYLLSAYFIFPKIKTELIELIKKS